MTYHFRKLGQYAIALLGVLTLSFFLIYKAPAGDPTKAMLGLHATEQDIENLKKELGLDESIFSQYVIYCKRLFSGKLGRSFISDFDIGKELMKRFPLTLELALFAIAISLVTGIALGLTGVAFKKADPAISFLVVGFGSLPVFYLALLLLWFLGYRLGWFPISGYGERIGVFLPAIALALNPMATIARITRTELIHILDQDYIRTAYSLGFHPLKVIMKYALKNTLLSVISSLSNSFAMILAGTFFVEYIFSWPGVGLLAVDAMLNYDYPVIQSIVLLTGVSFIAINLITEALYGLADPRVRR